jgi:anti-sigma factor RsiW
MNCQARQQQLTSYLDDELSSGQRIALTEHLKTCSACQSQLQALQDEQQLVRNVLNLYPRIKAAPDFALRVLDAVEKRRSEPDTFFDRLDAFFARPLPKLLGSSVMGIFCGALLVALLLPRGASVSGNATIGAGTAPQQTVATAAPRTPSRFYAQGRLPQEHGLTAADLMNDFTRDEKPLRRSTPTLKTPAREPLWNVDISASPLSLLSGSLC